jgi:predicted ester cyclase
MLTPEEHKANARQAFDTFFNQKNLAAIEEYCAPNYVGHFSSVPEPVRGPEGLRQFLGVYLKAFPDIQVTVEDVVVEGDKVAVRITLRGTHQGDLMGIPPTGKPILSTGIHILRLVGDKAVEQWANGDDLGLMQQLGVIPTPGQGGG